MGREKIIYFLHEMNIANNEFVTAVANSGEGVHRLNEFIAGNNIYVCYILYHYSPIHFVTTLC